MHTPDDLARARLRGAREWMAAWHDLVDPVPEATPRLQEPTRLCVGMATYNDFDGVWFTIASIIVHHPEVADDISFVVVDNHPTSAASLALKQLETRFPRYRYVPFRAYTGTVVRDIVFREAQADVVCCVDSHVLLRPGALAALMRYFEVRPDSKDLVQGPLIGSTRASRPATHFEPGWGASAFGQWGYQELTDLDSEQPYPLDSQGLGVFACRRDAWPGFNPLLRGYGSEEGYLHERVRRNGGGTVGIPALAWVHRFHRPDGIPYPNVLAARMRNYEIGWAELGWDLSEGREHFAEQGLTAQDAAAARDAVRHPWNAYDALMVLNADDDPQGWADLGQWAREHQVQWRLERVSTGSSASGQQRRAMGWRAAIEMAQLRGLRSFLCVEEGTREAIPVFDTDYPRLLQALDDPQVLDAVIDALGN